MRSRGGCLGFGLPRRKTGPPPVSVSPTLQVLVLSNALINEASPNGTVVGTITNVTSGSALSLSADGGGRFAISSGQIIATATPTDYETATSHSITIVETLAGATGSPKSTSITINVVNLNDTNPSAFSFTDVTNVALSALQTSNAITIAGLGASDSATATLSGAAGSQLQKNAGGWVSGPVTVVNGDTITVRHTSSNLNNTAVNTTLTVGTTSDTFTSTTLAAAGVPVPTGVAQFVDGLGVLVTAPINGQPLFIDPGPFTPPADSYDYQVYADGAVLVDTGSSGTFYDVAEAFYIPGDAIVGKTLSVKCHGINGAGPSTSTSNSVATSAVADIGL